MTWTGAFPFSGNLTWQREHSASISNKMTTSWYVRVRVKQHSGLQESLKVCGEDRLILVDLFTSVSHRKPQGLQEGPSPDEGMEKYF